MEQKKSGNYFFLDDWRSHFIKCSRSVWHQTGKRWHCGLTCLTELPPPSHCPSGPLHTHSSALSSRHWCDSTNKTRCVFYEMKAKLVMSCQREERTWFENETWKICMFLGWITVINKFFLVIKWCERLYTRQTCNCIFWIKYFNHVTQCVASY